MFTGKFLSKMTPEKRSLNVPLRPSSVWDAVRRRFVAGYRRCRAIPVVETSLNNYSVCRATSEKSEGVKAPSLKPEI
jgi:hypothetical protein